MTGYNLNRIILNSIFFVVIFLFPSAATADEGYSPSYTASPSAQASAITTSTSTAQCRVAVVKGNNELAPAEVTFQAEGMVNKQVLNQFTYDFGDGLIATGSGTMSHKYSQAGTYTITTTPIPEAGVKAASCTTQVTLKAAPLVPHRSECTGLNLTTGTTWIVDQENLVRVTGYDNKGELQGYKIVIAGKEWTDEGNEFIVAIPSADTYQVTAFVKDTTGAWVGGTGACVKEIRVKPAGMTTQPATGAPLCFWLLLTMAGIGAWRLNAWKTALEPR